MSEPDGEDLPEDTSTTGRVAVGDTATGKIGTQGDRDWFAVELEAGRIYRIDLEGSWTGAGTLVDPYLRGVYNEDHFFIVGTTVNDSGCGLNSRQTLTLDETGTYYVAAGAWGTREGTYRLSVADVTDTHTDDFAAGTGTTGAVAVGGSARGTIQHVNDRDWFAVELEAGKRYRIDLEGYDTGAGTLSDPYLRGIHDADGDRLAGTTNDDDGAGSNSRVYFTVDETGTYYVAAGGYANEKGTYTLSVTEYRDDFDAGTGTTGTVVVGGSTTGEIESPGDRDWFAVTLDAGRTYRIDLEGFFTAAGTLSVPDMQGIYDANGVLIVDITDGSEGAGYNSRVYFTAEEDATYYVAAGGYGRVVGTYTLSVTDTTDGDPDDFEAGTGTSGAVEVDGSATGDIEIFGDRDWFAVTLEAGGIYRIKLDFENRFATLYEPYVRGIHDANGILIDGTEDNKGGTGYATSRVYFTAEEAGAYYVAVGSDSDWEGAYTLSVTEIPDDFAAGTDTAGAVEVGGSETGEIEYYDDRDWFAVTLEAGRTYRIDLEGSWTGGGTLYNSYLRGIHDANGVLLADTTDNNGGAVYNSRVTFTPEEDAVYYVAAGGYVSSYSGYQAGTYTLFVTDVTDGVPDDYEAGTGTSGAVDVGGSVSGHLELWHDRDWFAVELEAGRFYSIALKGSWTGDNTLYDPVLRAIYDTDGNRVASAGGHWGGDRIATFAPMDGGTYYVEAGGGGDDEGTYTLSVTDVTHRISDDFEAGTGTTGRVEVGGSARGEIDYIGDRDWFAVELMAGNTYRFDQEHPPNVLYDPILRGIHDADGNFIAGTKDSSGSLGDSRVFFTPEDTGTYYVAAGAAADTTGSYTLSVINYSSVGDDYAAGTGTSGAVAVGGSATGRINYADDRDWFAVALDAGKGYQIDLEGYWTGAGTLRDPYLHGVHDANGDLIAGTTDDNGGTDWNSRMEFTADDTGTYYVAAGAGGTWEGAYTLSVTELAYDDYSATTETTGRVEVGGWTTGNVEPGGEIETGYDRDWFEVELLGGTTYRIDLEGRETADVTMTDPYLYGIHDANGVIIHGTVDDNGGRLNVNDRDNYNSRVTFTPTADGAYYVAAGGL